MTATLHLIHGFIGSGKTTFAKKLEKELNIIRFTHDEWLNALFGPKDDEDFAIKYEKIAKIIWKNIDRLLEIGQDVIIDFGHWEKESRDKIRQKAKDNNFNLKIYYIGCPKEIALQRVCRRNTSIPEDSMEISESTFNILWGKFEPASNEECFKIIDTS